MTLLTSVVDPVTTIHQQFYGNASISPIALELVHLESLTMKSVTDLVATSPGEKLGVAASYGEKRVLETLAFSSESRVLLIVMDETSKSAKPQKKILKDQLLCNASLEKHGFFMERLAAALHLDLGLHIQRAFDLASHGNTRGSMAAYKSVLELARPGDSLNNSAVEFIFAEQPFIQSRRAEFALRAWACYVAVQESPDEPGVIDTSAVGAKARSTRHSRTVLPDRLDR